MKKPTKPFVTMTFLEYQALSIKAGKWDRIVKAAKCDRLVEAFKSENKTA